MPDRDGRRCEPLRRGVPPVGVCVDDDALLAPAPRVAEAHLHAEPELPLSSALGLGLRLPDDVRARRSSVGPGRHEQRDRRCPSAAACRPAGSVPIDLADRARCRSARRRRRHLEPGRARASPRPRPGPGRSRRAPRPAAPARRRPSTDRAARPGQLRPPCRRRRDRCASTVPGGWSACPLRRSRP